MGLIRKAIVVCALIGIMPSPPMDQGQGDQPSSLGASLAYMAAAADTFADFKGFCERKPSVCSTAGYFAVNFEGKVRYSARLISEWATTSTATKTQPVEQASAKPPKPVKKPDLRLATTADDDIGALIQNLHGPIVADKDPNKG